MTSTDHPEDPDGQENPDDLMTAGRFGSLTLLSAKALRIYADRGLRVPYRVDPDNGYRYYAPDQMRTGWLIRLLRSAGLSLEEIGQIIGADPDTGLRHLEQSAEALQRRTETMHAVLNRVRLHLRQEVTMSHVSTALEVDRPVLSVLRRMRPEEMEALIPPEVGRLREVAAAAGLVVTGDAFGIFHAPVTDDSEGPLEITLPVDGLADLHGELRSYRLSGGLVANRYAEGPETWFPEILALYDEVHSWITEAGCIPVGPPREIWHNAPSDPDPLRLTISWPYATPPA
jgi:DNA-binding transcriptional MerR regulator